MPKEARFYKAVADATVKYGYRGLTTKRIAAEGSCSEALLYRYFKSEEDLLDKAFDQYIGVLIEGFSNKLETILPLDVKDMVNQGWRALYDTFVSIGPAFIFVSSYIGSKESTDESFHVQLNSRVRDVKNIHEFVSRAHSDLPSDNSFDTNSQINMIMFHIVSYAAKYTVLHPDGENTASLVNGVEQLSFRGYFDVWNKM